MPSPSRRAFTERRIARLFIVAVIGLQCVAGFKLLSPPKSLPGLAWLRIAPSPALWPFLDYNMYDRAHAAGATIDRWFLFGESATRGTVPLDESTLDLSRREFRERLLLPLRGRMAGAPDVAAALLRERGFGDVRRLWIERRPLVIEPEGLRELASEIAVEVALPLPLPLPMQERR